MKTLVIAAAASASAAFAFSKLWTPGTLAAAAFTPVLIALIKEALARSTDIVVRAVPPVKGVVRSARPGQSSAALDTSAVAEALPSGDAPASQEGRLRQPAPTDPATSAASDPASHVDPANPATWIARPGGSAAGSLDLGNPAERVPQTGEVTYHGSSRHGRGWRLAIVTGLLGFLVGAVIITVPELVAGGSAAGNGRETTFFGGGGAPTTTTKTETVTTQTTPTQTVTAPPVKTVTIPAPAATTTTEQPPAQSTTVAPSTTAPVVPDPSVPQPPG